MSTPVGRPRIKNENLVWVVATLTWVAMVQPATTGGGGGGGGPVTVADGADVTQGSIADAAWTSGSGTVISLLKKIASAGGSAVSIADGSDVAQGTTTDLSSASTVIGLLKNLKAALAGTLTVSGPLTDTQLRATAVPISAASLPLPSGAATGTKQDTGNTSLASLDTKLPSQGAANIVFSTPVNIAADQLALGLGISLNKLNTVPIDANSGTKSNGTIRVVLATDQPSLTNKLLVTPDSVALPLHQSTNIDQIGGSTLAIGQQLSAASVPVVLPATQITTLTPPAAITGYALEAGHLATIDSVQGTQGDSAWVSGNGTVVALLKKIASAGGSAVSIADGADTAQGTTTDLSSANTVIGLLKNLKAALAGTLTVSGPLTDTQLRASAVPVSGTVTANAGSNLNTSALALDATLTGGTQQSKITDGTNVATVKAASTLPAATDKALVVTLRESLSTPVTGTVTTTPPANASTNLAQVAGTTADVNSGTKSAGTLRVVLATDQPALTNKLLVTPDSVALPANQSVNVSQVNGITVLTGTGATGTGAQRVTVSVDSATVAGSASLPTGTNTIGSVKITDGTNVAKVTLANAQPANTDGAQLVNSIDTFAGTALASASRGVATVNTDIVNFNGKGIRVWQDLTVLGASSVCTFTIQEKDPVSGKFITILASAATGAGINSTGTAKLTVYPGLTAAANSIANDILPVNIRIVSTVATAASTFSIGYSLIP